LASPQNSASDVRGGHSIVWDDGHAASIRELWAEFADGPEQLEYASRLPPLDPSWVAEYIIGYLIGFARYPRPDDPAIDTEISMKSAGPDEALRSVSFRLCKTTVGGILRLVIERPQ